jgi:hypothetical protein
MTDLLNDLAKNVAARELMGFFTDPRLVELVNAAFDHELRESRKIAKKPGWEDEFELALRKNPSMH